MGDIKERLINREIPAPPVESTRSSPDIVDTMPRADVPKEVESWLEKIEKDLTYQNINTQQSDKTNTGQITIQSPKVTLPTTKKTFLAGFRQTISDVGFWFSNFILRQIKINDGEVEFKK